LVKSTLRPPKELARFFADPPLVGEESREDYDNLFSALAAAAKPADAIAWIYLGDFVNLTWEIRRERWLKHHAIEDALQAEVRKCLMPEPPPFTATLHLFSAGETDPQRAFEVERAYEQAEQWARDSKARRRIDKELASAGYDAKYIFTQALSESASDIDEIDKRISAYENRRNAVLREIDRHSESLARRLDRASSDIIDGEFTEAAE